MPYNFYIDRNYKNYMAKKKVLSSNTSLQGTKSSFTSLTFPTSGTLSSPPTTGNISSSWNSIWNNSNFGINNTVLETSIFETSSFDVEKLLSISDVNKRKIFSA